MPFPSRLRVDPIKCDAYGHCAELLPELIELDEWGYPMIVEGDVPEHLRGDALRAVEACPRLALRLEMTANSQRSRSDFAGSVGFLASSAIRRKDRS